MTKKYEFAGGLYTCDQKIKALGSPSAPRFLDPQGLNTGTQLHDYTTVESGGILS